jgi:hypothetical protein
MMVTRADTTPHPKELQDKYQRIAFIAVSLLPPIIILMVAWILPIPNLEADRTAMSARDYSDMWAAGHLITIGQGDTLFDLAAFNTALRDMFGSAFPHQVWPYPPPILLLAVPLAAIPLLPGFLFYTIGMLALLWWSLRCGGLTRTASAAVLLSPAVADNALTGQNGSLTAALLFGGLTLVHRRPVLGGAILGMLIIKPQLALLMPVCLISSGNLRALLAMIVSAGLLAVVTAVGFGLDTWVEFFLRTRPMIEAILQAPWQALPSQWGFASALMAARSVGAGLAIAYAVQAIVTLTCAAAAWSTWRDTAADPAPRAAFTAVLAILASPWAHSYDMIPLAVAIVMLVKTAHRASLILLAFAWFWPGAIPVLPMPLSLSVSSVVGIALMAWQTVRVQPRGVGRL